MRVLWDTFIRRNISCVICLFQKIVYLCIMHIPMYILQKLMLVQNQKVPSVINKNKCTLPDIISKFSPISIGELS